MKQVELEKIIEEEILNIMKENRFFENNIIKFNKLMVEMCEFCNMNDKLTDEIIYGYDITIKVIDFSKIDINSKISWPSRTKYENEIKYLRTNGFNRLVPFYVLSKQLVGKYYDTNLIQQSMLQINHLIKTARAIKRMKEV